MKSIERINSEIFKTNFKGIGNYRQYPVGEPPYTLLPLCFLAPIHSTHHTTTTTTVLYVIPSPHTCISTLLLWQFTGASAVGMLNGSGIPEWSDQMVNFWWLLRVFPKRGGRGKFKISSG